MRAATRCYFQHTFRNVPVLVTEAGAPAADATAVGSSQQNAGLPQPGCQLAAALQRLQPVDQFMQTHRKQNAAPNLNVRLPRSAAAQRRCRPATPAAATQPALPHYESFLLKYHCRAVLSSVEVALQDTDGQIAFASSTSAQVVPARHMGRFRTLPYQWRRFTISSATWHYSG